VFRKSQAFFAAGAVHPYFPVLSASAGRERHARLQESGERLNISRTGAFSGKNPVPRLDPGWTPVFRKKMRPNATPLSD
jgi:hypothetical protein